VSASRAGSHRFSPPQICASGSKCPKDTAEAQRLDNSSTQRLQTTRLQYHRLKTIQTEFTEFSEFTQGRGDGQICKMNQTITSRATTAQSIPARAGQHIRMHVSLRNIESHGESSSIVHTRPHRSSVSTHCPHTTVPLMCLASKQNTPYRQ
jgi:hypothetical protein